MLYNSVVGWRYGSLVDPSRPPMSTPLLQALISQIVLLH
jgi:hypothetical protein